jgi:hypothetical protein
MEELRAAAGDDMIRYMLTALTSVQAGEFTGHHPTILDRLIAPISMMRRGNVENVTHGG